MTGAITSIVIVGGGSAGWMAAAALSRFLPETKRITLVESDAIGTLGVGEATIPGIRTFNAGLGIDEHEFLAATGGSYKLGIEFRDWGAPGERYVHAFGDIGRPLGLIGFLPYWLRHRGEGGAHGLWDFSVAARAAADDRFAAPAHPGPLAWAYHFDASLYARFLRGRAEAQGVVRREGRIVCVERTDDGDIGAVVLEDGARVAGDLFVDCSGFVGLLIERELGAGFDSWAQWLPTDRAVAVPSAPTTPIAPLTRSTAREAGWQWRIPLQHRIGNGYVYSSRHISDDEAAATLLANLDTAPLADPRPIRFQPGRRRAQWVRNCIAIGLSAGFLEPLESTSLHLIQQGIAELLRLFPVSRDAAPERDRFNTRMAFEFDSVRDMVILHYHANRRDGALWREVRAMALPERLAQRIALFRSAGRIVRIDEELFSPLAWMQVMLGQGIVPERWHPIADAISSEELTAVMADAAASAARQAAQLPDHAGYLARTCPARL